MWRLRLWYRRRQEHVQSLSEPQPYRVRIKSGKIKPKYRPPKLKELIEKYVNTRGRIYVLSKD
jgi:hypothetical protein